MTNHEAYAELHCHSNFSLLDGASHPEELVKRAAEMGMPALALTDHDALYGVVRFAEAAKLHGVRPIFGTELTLEDNTHLTLLVENGQGWRNLSSLITIARHNAPKGQAILPLSVLPDYTDGLIALSGCNQGAAPQALLANDWQRTVDIARQHMGWFGRDHFFIELQNHRLHEDEKLNYKLIRLAEQLALPYVATNNVHYAKRDASHLQDILVCIRNRQTLDNSRSVRRPNSEYYLKSAQEMETLFSAYPDALRNTMQIADRCDFELAYGLQDLPVFPTPGETGTNSYLASLCEQALVQRVPDAPARAHELLAYELSVIQQSGLANYFLIVADMVRFAREQDILCQGRGSAANSFVAYLLGISPINPLVHDLVFERFLSPERTNTPDIDIDFSAGDDRDRVIQYIFEKWGRDHAAMVCTIITFQKRLARREVGKVLGVPIEMVEERASLLPRSERTSTAAWEHYEQLCQQLIDFPRHISIHNGGMILSREPLARRMPTEPASMEGRDVVQLDKSDLEKLGVVKFDILSLRTLAAIARTKRTVAQTKGIALDLEQLEPTDPAVYEMISSADTVGVFQVESRAQAQVLPRLLPRNYSDIVVTISLIRPGPILGNMVRATRGRIK